MVQEIIETNPEQINAQNENGSTPLICAFLKKNLEMVDLLLPRSNILITDNNGRLALHHAATNGNLEIIKKIIDATPSFSPESVRSHLTSTDKFGRTPLWYTTIQCTEDAIEYIFRLAPEAFFAPTEVGKWDDPSILGTSDPAPFFLALIRSQKISEEFCLKMMGWTNEASEDAGWLTRFREKLPRKYSFLNAAINRGFPKLVGELLYLDPESFFVLDEYDQTSLTWACVQDAKIFIYLMDYGYRTYGWTWVGKELSRIQSAPHPKGQSVSLIDIAVRRCNLVALEYLTELVMKFLSLDDPVMEPLKIGIRDILLIPDEQKRNLFHKIALGDLPSKKECRATVCHLIQFIKHLGGSLAMYDALHTRSTYNQLPWQRIINISTDETNASLIGVLIWLGNGAETSDLIQGLRQLHNHQVAELLIGLLDQNEPLNSLSYFVRKLMTEEQRAEIRHEVYFRHSLTEHLLYFVD